MAYQTLDFDKICRTCLAETTDSKSLFSVQYINEENLKLSELLSAFTSLEVCENDDLPKQVCLQCVHYMITSFSFQQQCQKSDSVLRTLLSATLQSQFIELKPLNIPIENALIPILRSNKYTTVQNEPIETNLNDHGGTIIGDSNNEIDNLGDESVSEVISLENRIRNLEENKNSEEDLDNKEEFKVNIVSTGDINPTNQISGFIYNDSETKDCLEVKLKGNELAYQLNNNPSDIPKYKNETQKVQEDETTQPLFPCEERGCFSCFTTKNDLKRHTKTHGRAHYCKPCNQMFSSASTLSRHVNNKHQRGKKMHMCSECGKGFGRSDELKRHLRIHTGEKPFRCEKCGKAFAQSFRLLEHMRAHSNEKNFVCAMCGKAFARYTSLLAHTKTHSGIKTHECKECGKKLCGSSSLAMHMKIHTGEKNYKCSYCEKRFASPSNLTTHKRMHTGEKPYVCVSCGKAFPDQSRLNVHNRIHSGEKPYVCSYCDRGCVSSSQLKKHLRIHTGEKPYECIMCEKRFYRNEDLKIHVKIHKGERNHICEVCRKGFYQATTLKVHMRIHTGEKPYCCVICNKSFSQTGPFSLHLKTHCKEENKIFIQDSEVNGGDKIIQYL